MKDCAENHALCKPSTTATLPTRVIDVRAEGQDPRLVITNGREGQYVALSYCWGDPRKHGEPFKTTRENYETHQEALPLDKLPATLRDAVLLCRRLGLQFLWIDAICIIQHDADDWAAESGKMCDVYSQAALTIAADHADGNSGGLFHSQAFGAAPTMLSPLRGRKVYARRDLARLHNDITLLLRQPAGDTQPIHTRAWTFQESLLSHRSLRYTSDELVWECNTLRECECRRGAPVELDEESTRVFRTPELFSKMDGAKQAYLQWRQIVQVFTERELSFDDDRLAAVSGMARQFARMMQAALGREGEKYLAGLWEGDLATELLWTMEDDYWRLDFVQQRRPKTWRAPSWSWAAMEGPVMFLPMSGFTSALKVLNAVAEPVDAAADEYGRVKSGRLVLRGRVRRGMTARATAPREGTDNLMGVVRGMKYVLQDDTKPLSEAEMHASTSFIPDDAAEGTGTAPVDGEQGLAVLLVGRTAMAGARTAYAAFLVLRAKSEGDVFERVGVSFRGAEWETEGVDLFEGGGEEVVTLV